MGIAEDSLQLWNLPLFLCMVLVPFCRHPVIKGRTKHSSFYGPKNNPFGTFPAPGRPRTLMWVTFCSVTPETNQSNFSWGPGLLGSKDYTMCSLILP